MTKEITPKKQEKKPKSTLDILIYLIIMLAVVGIGMFAVNQTMGYFYKSKFLQTPCALCEELNPHLSECFKQESTAYQDQFGNNQKIKFNLSGINIPES